MQAARIAALAAGIAAATPSSAAADGFSVGARPVWFVTGGGTAGGSVVADARGAFVGGELGLVRIVEQWFAGVYADAYYDFGADATYVTAGPELGWIRRSRTMPISLGVDGGGALRVGDGTDVGVTGRAFVAVLGSVALFGRYAYLDTDDEPEHVVQIGVTIKFPLAPPFGAGTRRAR